MYSSLDTRKSMYAIIIKRQRRLHFALIRLPTHPYETANITLLDCQYNLVIMTKLRNGNVKSIILPSNLIYFTE